MIKSMHKMSIRIVSIIVIISMIGIVSVLSVSAQTSNDTTVYETLLRQAEHASNGSMWENACEFYEEALKFTQVEQREDVELKLEMCRAHWAVDKRYGDGSVAKHIRSLSFEQGCDIVKRIWMTIREQFYQPLDTDRIIHKALMQMIMVLEKKLESDLDRLNRETIERLSKDLQEILNEVKRTSDYGFDRLYYRLSGLSIQSEKAGLGDAWPMVELAYALAASLDRYSYLLSPEQYDRMYDQLLGHYSGIGVDLIFTDQYPFVFDVVPGGSAQQSGIKPGDRLHKVDGKDLNGKNSEEVRKLLTGEQNSETILTVLRNENSRENARLLTLAVRRGTIEAQTVRDCRILSGKTGYFRVTSFDFDTAWQMRSAIEQLKRDHVESLMIDLRNNGGGVLDAAVDAARLFLGSGMIVTVKSNHESVKYRAGGDNFACFDMPVILLTNKNTASAAELFAAALRDHQRAILVGDKTFGKGVVQTIYPITGFDCGLCITTANYIPPDGNAFDGIGLEPDRKVKSNDNNPEITFSALDMISLNDPFIQSALARVSAGSS